MSNVLAPSKVARPRDLREALGFAFAQRGRIRWVAGRSPLLDLEFGADGPSDGRLVVDVGAIADFREVRADRSGWRIGAFAELQSIAAEPALQTALGADALAPDVARFRLGALGAKLVIAGVGQTRSAPLQESIGAGASRPLGPAEIPVALELSANAPPVAFGTRRLRRRDGEATFDLRVFAALNLSGFHRIGTATLAYALDGAPPVEIGPVNVMLRGSIVAKTTFPEAARIAAGAFNGDDVRSNTLRRTIIPLTLSALKDAYDAGRKSATPTPAPTEKRRYTRGRPRSR